MSRVATTALSLSIASRGQMLGHTHDNGQAAQGDDDRSKRKVVS